MVSFKLRYKNRNKMEDALKNIAEPTTLINVSLISEPWIANSLSPPMRNAANNPN